MLDRSRSCTLRSIVAHRAGFFFEARLPRRFRDVLIKHVCDFEEQRVAQRDPIVVPCNCVI